MKLQLLLAAILQSASLALAQPDSELLAGCASCHGLDGQGIAAQQAPALAGQDPDYLARQLTAFRDGLRGAHPEDTPGQIMAASSSGLHNDEITRLSHYYANLPMPTADGTVPVHDQDMKAAEQLYQATCSRCHGQRAEGYPQLGAPALTLLDAVYLQRQMDNYTTGRRGSGADADVRSAWMRSIASHIRDADELAGVINYITAIPMTVE